MTSPPLTLLAPVLAGVFLSTSCAQGASRRSAYDAGPAQRADDAGRFAGLDAGPDGGTIPPRDGGPGVDGGSGVDGRDGGPSVDAGPTPPGCELLPASGSITLGGNTGGGLTWDRPYAESCPAGSISSGGSDVPYATHVLCNHGLPAGTFDLELSGSIDDSYLVVYDGLGLPANTLACRTADDDGAGNGQARVSGLALEEGDAVTVVVTGFNRGDWGSYALTVTRR
ncbi:MAG TPA: hypothetical protein RMH85_01065 [Polyangiaceae bacterium LLY-WYZ-15_(1-7)]|nr:hypothetical protein [Polyangiaceae bacterium LLY-WYZ-15_(1-7)]HJL05347.1 hypothetical protein [Polyangiaceae bacterium LLY-WYZ-15_(1-7)]HJL07052.1 hypothetical protein [Polyangiaceae bacterium LLY-WYZ-15_(1-7)]HJL21690.1 hypothetical protein [Polyangiaceae bacterium LLY-WYZ-15_(1-7)]HJL38238.1 hypothetical protein [Polyangiaceae bacterium LLY-WYZ-15_(1-7)]